MALDQLAPPTSHRSAAASLTALTAPAPVPVPVPVPHQAPVRRFRGYRPAARTYCRIDSGMKTASMRAAQRNV